MPKSTNCRPTGVSYMLLLFFIGFLLPLVTMIYCYLKIYLKVRRHRRQLHIWSNCENRMKAEMKTSKVVFTVLFVFLVCWIPFVTVYVLSSNVDSGKISSVVYLVSGCLAAAHSAVNPIIYFALNKTFRREFIDMIRNFSISICDMHIRWFGWSRRKNHFVVKKQCGPIFSHKDRALG